MEFSRPEYWSGYLFPSPGDLPNPGVKSRSPALQAESPPTEPSGKPKGRLNVPAFRKLGPGPPDALDYVGILCDRDY